MELDEPEPFTGLIDLVEIVESNNEDGDEECAAH